MYKTIKISLIILKSIFIVVLFLFTIVFTSAGILNKKVTNELNEFIEKAEFEYQVDNIKYYAVYTDKHIDDTIIRNYNDDNDELAPTLGNVGDIFIMPQSRIDYVPLLKDFITYLAGGHAGMIVDNNMLVESMGGTQKESYVFMAPTDLFHEERNVIGLRVKAPKEDRIIASEYAKTLVGKRYSYFYLWDTKNKYYCTNICSRSYGKEAKLNYELDSNGFICKTQDLILSKQTYITFVKIVKGDIIEIYYLKGK